MSLFIEGTELYIGDSKLTIGRSPRDSKIEALYGNGIKVLLPVKDQYLSRIGEAGKNGSFSISKVGEDYLLERELNSTNPVSVRTGEHSQILHSIEEGQTMKLDGTSLIKVAGSSTPFVFLLHQLKWPGF